MKTVNGKPVAFYWASMLLLATLPAAAQEVSSKGDSGGDGSEVARDETPGTIEEVIVTGDRANRWGTDVVQAGSFRGAKALDVPLTVSVIPSEVLESQQAVDILDAVRNTAGVSSSSIGPVAYNNLTVRGIEVDTRANYKLNGALNILSSTSFPLENKDRVEVLKGASALYYGFSSPSGIINLTSKRPTEEPTLFARTFGDSNGGLGGHVDVGNTVGEFGYRLIGLYADIDSGIDYSEGDRYLVSGAFDYNVTDDLIITADIEHFERTIVEPATIRVRVPDAETPVELPDLSRLDPRSNIAGAPWADNDTSETNFLVHGVWKFTDNWNFSAYYGQSDLRRIRYSPRFDVANNPTAIDSGEGAVAFAAQDTSFENTSYAAELFGVMDLGRSMRNEVLLGASRNLRSLASPEASRTPFPQNYLNPRLIPDPHLVFGPRPPASEIDDKGLYLFDRLTVNETLDLLGGVRYSDYTDDGSINAVTKTPYHVAPWSWSGGLVVKPKSWISIYGTYIEGLEATASAPIDAENALETPPPTESVQYEAGVKLQPRPDLLIQAAYFDITRDAAYLGVNPDTGNERWYTNGEQNYSGWEVSLTGYVTEDLALYATATTVDAHYQSNPDLDGLWVEGTPENTWSLAGEYTLSWLNPGLAITAGMYHVGKQAINATNNAFTPSYTTFDLGASYTLQLKDHEVVMRVNGQNIENESYWASTGFRTLALGLPRVVKFSVSVNF